MKRMNWTGLLDMKVVVLACVLAGVSAAKISPFVPREIVRHDVDIARVNYEKEKRDLAQALKSEKAKQIEKNSLISAQEEATTEKPEDESDVVPIVVGSVMGGIIVVVLVGYFFVRARRAKE